MTPTGLRPVFLCLLFSLCPLRTPAQTLLPDFADGPPVQMAEFLVTTTRVGQPVLAVPRGDLRPPEPNLAPELLSIPGVFGHSRATDALEPSIRGLGFDRVATTFNGIPLVNASPERTYSPVAVLGPLPRGELAVIKALPSVTLGPATTGGRLTLTTTPAGDIPAGFSGQLSSTWHAGRGGHTSLARLAYATGPWHFAATGFVNDLGNYRAPDGRTVAARLQDFGAGFTAGWHNKKHDLQLDLLHRRLRKQDAVSLPLDGRNSETQLFTLTDRWTFDAGALREIDWRLGGSRSDPFITSAARPAPTPLIYAQALARTLSGGVTTVWRTGDDDTLALGADHAYQNRRAIRTTAAGQDFIWPDATYTDTGVFAEWNRTLAPFWKMRLGARADTVRSDARAADKPALGKPVREQYVLYNGTAAAVVPRSDHTGAVNVLFTRTTEKATAYFGTGLSVQPAQVMERYRAFLNALGGDGRGGNAVELGNPALAAERNLAFEAGGVWRHAAADLEATAYYYRIGDFIHRTVIGATLPPLAPMTVFGYRNIDADFSGGELGLTLKPAKNLTVPLTFALARGRNRTTGTSLAEIPPWEATAALRARFKIHSANCWTDFGARLVGHRNNPAPLENPLYGHAGGFAIWHLRAGVPLGRRLHVEAGIENLFNHTYTEYLVPPVAPFRPAAGDLLPGQRIPAPRRTFWLSANWQL